MAYSYQQCLEFIKQVYPGMYPVCYVLHKDRYYFDLFKRGESKENAMMDIHFVDINTGDVSGSIPTMWVLTNKELAEKFRNPSRVQPEDQLLQHGIKKNSSYSIRMTKPRQTDILFSNAAPETYLKHYGIDGMRWGVRNGPPYPLSTKTHNRVVKSQTVKGLQNAKKAESQKGQSGKVLKIAGISAVVLASLIAVAVVKANTHHNDFAVSFPKIDYEKREKERQERLDEAAREEFKKQRERGQDLELYESNKEHDNVLSRKSLSDIADIKHFSSEDPPKLIAGEHSYQDDMSAVNPTFGLPIPGNSNNCVLCSFAYDLRRRGYDVTAKLSADGTYTDKIAKELYENAKVDQIVKYDFTWSFDKARKMIEDKYPEGSRGVLTVMTTMAGGHAMAFEINHGKLMVIDAQTNETRDFTDEVFGAFNPNKTEIIRTDNLKVNMDKLDLVVGELKPDWQQVVNDKKRALERAAS